LRQIFRKTRHMTNVEALIRIMVLNRLCDPESKLGVLRWVETVALPDVPVAAITHQQLLRSMDALMEQQSAVDAVVAGLLRPLIDQDLSVVFDDLTTIRSEGLIARQFLLGACRRQRVVGKPGNVVTWIVNTESVGNQKSISLRCSDRLNQG
jgi:hypothetical protein